MSSRYYVARRRDEWPGVVEVLDADPGNYYHHANWPERSRYPLAFIGTTVAECTDPVDGTWDPFVVDEDLLLDEGL